MFWRLVLAVEQEATALLGWSTWRRWHQAWARYHHYRRRGAPAQQPGNDTGGRSQGEVLEVVWCRLAAVLPPTKRKGRPYAHDRRVVLEAIVHVMQTGCTWHTLPAHFPPWQTVYAQLTQWRRTGIWDAIWAGLESTTSTS